MHLRDPTDAPDFLLRHVLTLHHSLYSLQALLVLLADSRILGCHLRKLGS